MGVDILAIADAELKATRAKIAALECEATEIETFLRVAARFASMEPQPQAAQTGPAMHPAPSASAEQASVESSATSPSAMRNGFDGTSEGQGATGAGTAGETPATGASHSEVGIPTPPKTPAPQPGSEAIASDAATVPAGEASRPDASPAPTSTRQRVKQLHDEHPEYTRREAWEALGITEGSLDGHSHSLRIRWTPQPEPRRFEPAAFVLPREPIAPDETVMDIVQQRPRQYAKGTQFWLRDRDGQYLNRYCTAMTRVRKEAWTGTEDQVAGCRRAFDIARDLRDQPVEREGAQA